MKAHIGVDAESGLAHSVVSTTVKVADISQTDALRHGQEQWLIGDGAYRRRGRELHAPPPAEGPTIVTPYRRPAGCGLPTWQQVHPRPRQTSRKTPASPLKSTNDGPAY